MRTSVMILVLLALACATAADEATVTAEALEEQIRELRREARYTEALEEARELLALRQSDPDAKAFEVADAERLVATLEHVSGLSEDAWQALAAADSLDAFLVECWRQGRYVEGVQAAERQLAIRREFLGAEHPEVAVTLGRLATLLDEQVRSAECEALFRDVLAMQRKLLGPVHPNIASTLGNLAHAVRAQGNFAEAEPLYLEALDTRKAALGEDHPLVLRSLNNLAAFYAEWDDYATAEPLAREALALGRRLFGEDHPTVGNSLMILANILTAQGNYGASEPLYREVLGIYRRHLGEKSSFVAMTVDNLAMILHDQGDYVGAEPLYREALEMRREIFGEEHPDVAKSLNNLAEILYVRRDYAGAETLFRDALGMSRDILGEQHPLVAQILHNLACVFHATGDLDSAEPLYLKAVRIDSALLGWEHSDVASTLSSLGDLCRARGDYARADSVYREALGIRRRVMGAQHPEVVTSLCEIAALARLRGRSVAAESLFTEAARIYDVARTRVGFGLKRATFLQQRQPHANAAAARLALGRFEEAWPAVEKSLARSLLDLLMVSEHRELTGAEASKEDSLRTMLGDLERELATWARAAQGDTSSAARLRVREVRDRLLAAEVEWSALQQTLSAEYPMTEGGVYPLGRVQAALSGGEAIVGWLDAQTGEDRFESWGYVMRGSGEVGWIRLPSLPEAAEDLTPLARGRAFRDAAADPNTPTQVVARDARSLWSYRIEPLAGLLEGVRDLIVVPSGAVLGIPMEALIDDEGRHLSESFSVSYVPSATVHAWLAEGRAGVAEGRGRALLIGDPPFSDAHLAAMERDLAGEEPLASLADPVPDAESLRGVLVGNEEALAALPRLPGTREEIQTVAQVVGNPTVLLGAAASEQELTSLAEAGRLSEFEVVHFATHALVDDDRPERSALVLSQANLPDPLGASMAGTRIYDGLVTAEEITREWRLAADLVTLSACETGLGTEVIGEGYVGLAHAFLQAGARSVVVSIWKVDDTATSSLMGRFYRNWLGRYEGERAGYTGEPMSKAEALQEAKHWLREYTDVYGERPYEHPYYWSAFILIGDRS